MALSEWSIPELLQLSGGYWSACALHAGVKLDIFSALDGVSLSVSEVAAQRNTDPRATAMLLDALSALGLVAKTDATYTATPFAARNLSKSSPGYLGHIIMHHHHLMSGWEQLDEAVKSGGPVRKPVSHGDDEEVRESFLMGMFNLASQLAPTVAHAVDLSACRTLLDLGGGPGTYAIHFCRGNQNLSAVVYDLPTTRKFAEATIARYDLSSRISFSSGDFHADPLPSGFDAAWLSHILHSDGPEACGALLSKTVAALKPGGILMVQEFVLSDAGNAPLFPTLFSLNMLLGTDAGQAYSEGQLCRMMTAAGLTDVTRLPVDLPNGTGIMWGRKPAQ